VGSIGVEYDRLHDVVIFTLVDADTMNIEGEEGLIDADAEPPEHHLFTTRGQAKLLGEQAEKAVVAGRPLCPRCGLPMEEFGHFCPPTNPKVRRGGEVVH